MEGPPGDRGVNYRTLQQLFNTVEAQRDETSFTISVSLLEVLPTQAVLAKLSVNNAQICASSCHLDDQQACS